MDFSAILGLIPKVKIHGVEVDLGPIASKLFGKDKEGLKAEDLVSLLPVVIALVAAYANKPAAPQPAPQPVPEPPVVKPPAEPAPPAGDPLASLKVGTVWKKKQGVNTNEPGQVNLATLGWGDKVALDFNGADAAGVVRADLVHGPIHVHVKWDGKEEVDVWGENGVLSHQGELEQVNVGGKEYFETGGGVAVVKIFKEGFADANRHQIEFWGTAKSALGEVKSNVLQGFVN